jgi:hypothetical protein
MLVGILEPPKQPNETYVVAIDFTPELTAGNQSITTRTVTSKRRNDDQDSSGTFLTGSPGGAPGPSCTIRVQGGLAGEIHRVSMSIVTNLGNAYQNELDVPIEES